MQSRGTRLMAFDCNLPVRFQAAFRELSSLQPTWRKSLKKDCAHQRNVQQVRDKGNLLKLDEVTLFNSVVQMLSISANKGSYLFRFSPSSRAATPTIARSISWSCTLRKRWSSLRAKSQLRNQKSYATT